MSQGRITVNEQLAHLGQRVSAADQIAIDGKAVVLQPEDTLVKQVLLYHKPLGEICSHDDPQRRPTVFRRLPALETGRWVIVGRLDINTSGLLLFTTWGELAHRLMHPSYEIVRTYHVRIQGEASAAQLATLREGIALEDGIARFDSVHLKTKLNAKYGQYKHSHWYEVTLKEGRYREVRRLWQALDLPVKALVRISYGALNLPPDLRAGQWRLCSPKQMVDLLSLVALP